MVERFSDDETAYSEWLAEHPDGFVFNHFGGPPAFNVIHRARCGHLHRTDNEGRRTAVEKLAATGLREMVSRVKQIRGSGQWKFCADCAPAAPERAGAGRPRDAADASWVTPPALRVELDGLENRVTRRLRWTLVGHAVAILTGVALILLLAG